MASRELHGLKAAMTQELEQWRGKSLRQEVSQELQLQSEAVALDLSAGLASSVPEAV